MHWSKSLLVIHKTLRLFVNTLTVHDKHYLFNRHNLTQPIQVKLSQKRKTFCQFSFAFLKSILNFKHLLKKDDLHSWSLSGNTCSAKIWLHKCLKSRVSEDPQTDSAPNLSKQCYILNGSTFITFINHCESSCIGKSLFQ